MNRITDTARPIDGALHREIDVNRRHVIVTDEPTRLGGADAGPAPHELVPATLAACVSTQIVAYAGARDLELDELRIDVVYQPEPPCGTRSVLHVPPGLSDDQVKRLRRIADARPVKRVLEAGFTFDQSVVAITPSTPRPSSRP